MTEFKSSGFDIVDKFFEGKSNDGPTVNNQTDENNDATTRTAHSQRNKNNNRPTTGRQGRGGVGHSTGRSSPSSSDAKTDEDLRKAIMKVGRTKRSRDRGADDDDDDDNVVGNNDNVDDDDPDNDLGRTAIATYRTYQPSKQNPDYSKAKSAKKLGKKERMKLKKLHEEGKDVAESKVTSGSTENNTPNTKAVSSHPKEQQQPDEKRGQELHQKPKRKRRKVRSRQKNIYKDNRSNDEKPSHLIPGSKNFQGRPLTKETRKRLNLPESQSRTKTSNRGYQTNGNNHSDLPTHSSDGNLFVIDREPTGFDHDLALGGRLAVDDLQSSDEEDDQGEVIGCSELDGRNEIILSKDTRTHSNQNSKNKKKTGTTKKRRYKNLM